jgi:transposase InsO family protein
MERTKSSTLSVDSLHIELLNRQRWIAEWIKDFYNPLRRHSSLGYLTTDEHDALHAKQTQATFS